MASLPLPNLAGALWLNMALLPPSVTRITGGGPGVHRSLALLRSCVAEEGICAVLAANQLLVWLTQVSVVSVAGVVGVIGVVGEAGVVGVVG